VVSGEVIVGSDWWSVVQISDCKFQIADFRFKIANFRQQIQIADSDPRVFGPRSPLSLFVFLSFLNL
jgi:hypothetical protein